MYVQVWIFFTVSPNRARSQSVGSSDRGHTVFVTPRSFKIDTVVRFRSMILRLFPTLSSRERVTLGVWWAGLLVLLVRGNTVFEDWATLFVTLWSGGLLLLHLTLAPQETVRAPKVIIWTLGVTFIAALISLGTTVNPDASLKELVRMFSLLVLILTLTTLFQDPQRWRWGVQSLMVLLVLIALGSAIQYFLEGPPRADHQLRGPFFWYNQMGGFLAVSLPLLWGTMVVAKTPARKFLGGMFVLGVIVLLALTFSRGSWLIGIAALLLSLYVLRPRIRQSALLVLGGGGVLLIVALQFPGLAAAFLERGASLASEFGSERTSSGNLRVDAVYVARRALEERPVVGTGAGTFADAFLHFQRAPWRYAAHAHNEVLEMFAELGTVGGMTFFLFFAAILQRAWRALRVRRDLGTSPGNTDVLLTAAMGVSLIAGLLRFLIDVDWSFLGLQALFATLVALLFASPALAAQGVRQPTWVISRRIAGSFAAILLTAAAWLGAEAYGNRQFTAALAQNNLERTARVADRLVLLNPWSEAGHRLRAQTAFLQKDFRTAEEALREATTLAPWRSDAWIALGELSEWQKDPATARTRYERAIRMTPFRTPHPAIRLAKILRKQGDLAGAERLLLESAEQRFPLNDDLGSQLYFLRWTPTVQQLPRLYRELLAVLEKRGNTARAAFFREQWARIPDLPPLL
ncbi:MAG: hypothetical protein G01um101438_383 [Parcubacteria group bacterium Gr01-1014_38]|nr:MAG: hypothetical protein G01um101438_383 [Parcubacteria group bacterium Gr01-1014_38]